MVRVVQAHGSRQRHFLIDDGGAGIKGCLGVGNGGGAAGTAAGCTAAGAAAGGPVVIVVDALAVKEGGVGHVAVFVHLTVPPTGKGIGVAAAVGTGGPAAGIGGLALIGIPVGPIQTVAVPVQPGHGDPPGIRFGNGHVGGIAGTGPIRELFGVRTGGGSIGDGCGVADRGVRHAVLHRDRQRQGRGSAVRQTGDGPDAGRSVVTRRSGALESHIGVQRLAHPDAGQVLAGVVGDADGVGDVLTGPCLGLVGRFGEGQLPPVCGGGNGRLRRGGVGGLVGHVAVSVHRLLPLLEGVGVLSVLGLGGDFVPGQLRVLICCRDLAGFDVLHLIEYVALLIHPGHCDGLLGIRRADGPAGIRACHSAGSSGFLYVTVIRRAERTAHCGGGLGSPGAACSSVFQIDVKRIPGQVPDFDVILQRYNIIGLELGVPAKHEIPVVRNCFAGHIKRPLCAQSTHRLPIQGQAGGFENHGCLLSSCLHIVDLHNRLQDVFDVQAIETDITVIGHRHGVVNGSNTGARHRLEAIVFLGDHEAVDSGRYGGARVSYLFSTVDNSHILDVAGPVGCGLKGKLHFLRSLDVPQLPCQLVALSRSFPAANGRLADIRQLRRQRVCHHNVGCIGLAVVHHLDGVDQFAANFDAGLVNRLGDGQVGGAQVRQLVIIFRCSFNARNCLTYRNYTSSI